MGVVGSKEPRSVFLALPFAVRDALKGYKETILVLEDRFGVTIKHGDHTNDAVQILERATELMHACRVRIFDVTTFKPNVMFEFGIAKGAHLPNLYALRRREFGNKPLPTMMNNIDIPTYSNTKTLESILSKALENHFWPTDTAFTENHLPWLARQIRELTYPGCETDKYELADATGLADGFVTRAINQYFVATGEAVALGVGPAPRYRFDYKSIRPVPDNAGAVRLPPPSQQSA